MTRRLLVTTAAMLAATAPTFGQAVKFERKYTPGEKVEVVSTEQITQVMDLGFGAQKRSTTSSKKTLVSNGQRDSKGELTRTYSLLEMKVRSEDPVGVLDFDSKNPKAAKIPKIPGVPSIEKQVMESLNSSLKAIRTYTYNAQNVLVKAQLSGIDLSRLPLEVAAEFDEKKMLQTRLAELKRFPPKQAVKPGDTWEGQSVMQLGAGQELRQRLKYTYVGKRERDDRMLDKISVITLTAEIKGEAAIAKVISTSLKPDESSKGEIWFDREAGRLVASKVRLNVKGKVKLEFQGQQAEAQIDLKIATATEARKVP